MVTVCTKSHNHKFNRFIRKGITENVAPAKFGITAKRKGTIIYGFCFCIYQIAHIKAIF